MKVGSARSAGKALKGIVWGYCAIPVALAAVLSASPASPADGRTGPFPEPLVWSTVLLGTALSWTLVRKSASMTGRPSALFRTFLIGLVFAEFPVLLAFLNVLTGGRPGLYFGTAAAVTVFFLAVALPAASALSAP